MSIRNPDFTNDKVIPVIESGVFEQHPEARFAVGILAVGHEVRPGLENEMRGYFDLRRKVYYEQTGQLGEADIQPDGTDKDEDDGRSVHFAIIENRPDYQDQRVVASTRLIVKGSGTDAEEQRALPVEEFCPEIFEAKPAQVKSLEVSRLIARNEKAGVQEVLRWRMYAAALGYIAAHDLGPTYGVVEPWLLRHLQSTIPVNPIGEARYIPHYLDYNLPIEVDTDKFVDQMKITHPGVIEDVQANENAMSFFGRARKLKAAIDASNVVVVPRTEPMQEQGLATA